MNRKNFSKRVLALFLVFIMLIQSVFSGVPVLADEGDVGPETGSSTEESLTPSEEESISTEELTDEVIEPNEAQALDKLEEVNGEGLNSKDSESFNVAPEAPGIGPMNIISPEAPTHTYIFQVDGAEVARQIVKSNESLLEPDVPIKEGFRFLGWYYTVEGVDTKIEFSNGLYNVGTISDTREIALNASFEPISYVYFIQGDNVIYTKEVVPGTTTNASGVASYPIEGKRFVHWSTTPDGAAFDFTTPITADINLYAVFTDAYEVTFDSQGGTFVEAQYIEPDGVVVQPTDPVLVNSTFLHWSTTIGGPAYDFTTPVTGALTLYAVWSDTAPYQVVYWIENADDTNYSYHSTETRTGVVGDPAAYTQKGIQYFTYDHGDNLTIARNGSTIVNVYYSRNTYTLRFQRSTWSGTVNVIAPVQVKHGASTQTYWDQATTAYRNATGSYPTWRDTHTNENSIEAPVMPTQNLTFMGSNAGSTLTYIYFMEIDKQPWVASDVIKTTTHYTSNPGSTTFNGGRILPGFTWRYVTQPNRTSDTYHFVNGNWEVRTYYSRNSYIAQFFTNDEVGTISASALYQQPMSSLNTGRIAEYVKDVKTRADGQIFVGWYDNAEFQGQPFDFTGTMPAKNVTYYAKWVEPQRTVTYHMDTNPTSTSYSFKVDRGSTITEDQLNKNTKPQAFLGWYILSNDFYVPYDFSSSIVSDIELYPLWETQDGYNVTYDVGGQTGAVAPVDNNDYQPAILVKVLVAPTNPPTDQVFLGWKLGDTIYQPGDSVQIMDSDITFVAVWGDIDTPTTLTYEANGGEGGPIVVDLANNASHTIQENTFTRDGYLFNGWRNAAGERFDPDDVVTIDRIQADTANVLYAQWIAAIDITATKVWAEVPEGIIVPTTYFRLYRQIEGGNLEAVPEAELKELVAGVTEVTWPGLPETDPDGNPYTFSVREVDMSGNDYVPVNYTKAENGLLVTNSYVSPTTTVTANKVWDGGPAAKPTVWFKLYRNIANGEVEEVPNAEILVLENGNLQVSWTNIDEFDHDGNPYIFTVKEVNSGGTDLAFEPENYTKAEAGLTVTNSYVSPTRTLMISKHWVNGPATDHVPVALTLYRQAGDGPIELVEVPYTTADGTYPGVTTAYDYTWANLPTTDGDGNPYTYFYTEELVENYDRVYQRAQTMTINGVEQEIGVVGIGPDYWVRNTYVSPATTNVTVTKEWTNGANAIPTSIQVQLLQNTNPLGNPVTITDDGSGNWTYTWTNLVDNDANGNPFRYEVRELPVEHFTSVVSGTQADGYLITNTYASPTTDISLTKLWAGDEGHTNRPTSITLQLLRNEANFGEAVTVTPDVDGNWTYAWSELDLTDENGNAYTYSVVEVNTAPGYTPVLTGTIQDGFTLTNTYEADDVIVDTSTADAAFTTKIVEGTGFDPATFRFTLIETDSEGNPLEGAVEQNATATFTEAGTQIIGFGNFTYTEAGTYYYAVTETNLSDNGWTNEAVTKIVTVTVTDNGEGQLVATVDRVNFTNTYRAAPITIDTTDEAANTAFAQKTVEGTGFNETTFDFTLIETDEAGNPLEGATTVPASLSFTAAGTQVVDFGSITYDDVGTHYYQVAETTASGDGWTNENVTKTVVVVITDDGHGQLIATVTGVTFTNVYAAAPVTVDSTAVGTTFAEKTVVGAGFNETTFDFTLVEADATGVALPDAVPVTATVNATTAGTQTINLGSFTYTEPGTHYYLVTETTASADGWTNEAVSKLVTVVVTDNGVGQLEANVTSVVFTNTYEAAPITVDSSNANTAFGQKRVVGSGFNATSFDFTLIATDSEGTPLEGAQAITSAVNVTEAGDQVIDFGIFTYTEAGTYYYLVEETNPSANGWTNDTTAKLISVVVTDNGAGQLVATVNGVIFVNSYETDQVTIDSADTNAAFAQKTVTGTGFNPTTFNFTLVETDAEGNALTDTVPVNANVLFTAAGTQSVNFGSFTYTNAGTYYYQVAETTASGNGWTNENVAKTVTVVVTDNGLGQLEAAVTGVSFTNTYKANEVNIDSGNADTAFARKTVVGTGFAPTRFAFTLIQTDSQGNPLGGVLTKQATINATVAGTQAIDFDQFIFTEAGTYYYLVEETTASGNGWTNETSAKLVSVVVTDNGQGQLVASVNTVTFTNIYQAAPTTVDTTDAEANTAFAVKSVEGTGFNAKTFNFTMVESDNEGNALEGVEPMNASLNFTEAGMQVVNFGSITFTETGTYYYAVEETTASGNGWTNENVAKMVTVVVTNNGEGQLVAEVTGVSFTNTYKAAPTTIDTTDVEADTDFAVKNAEGIGFAANTFDFTLVESDSEGNALEGAEPMNASLSFTEAGMKIVDFGTFTYDEAGTYYYQVTETTASGNGWTNETVAKTVTVVVTDNGQGQLEAIVAGVSFTNTYKAAPTTIDTTDAEANTAFAEKNVEGTGFAAKTFDFTLVETDSEGNALEGAMAMNASLSFTEAGMKIVDFGTFTYDEVGTYYYAVEETSVSGNGWTNETVTKIVTVVVTDNGNGQLVATVTGVSFTNIYKAAPTTIDTNDAEANTAFAEKNVDGTGFAAKTFDFTLVETDSDGNALEGAEPMNASLSFTEAGIKIVDFGTFTYEEVGTYYYEIAETTESGDGWTNEAVAKTVTVEVTDNGQGQLVATVTGVSFTNIYKAAPTTIDTNDAEANTAFAEKIVEGTGFEAKTFDFTLVETDSEGNVLDGAELMNASLSFTEAGMKIVDFVTFTYDEAGTYYYQVAEMTESGDGWTNEAIAKTVTVEVTDNGQGQLVATVTGVSFTNTYKATPTTIDTTDAEADQSFANKTVVGTGFKATTFDFTLIETDSQGNAIAGGLPMNASLSFAEAGTKAIDFGTFTYDEAGTYYYQVTETTPSGDGWTNEAVTKTVTVEVTDNGQGQLVATVTGVSFTNTYKANPTTIDTTDAEANTAFARKIVAGTGFKATTFDFTLIETDSEGNALAGELSMNASLSFTEAGIKFVDFGTFTYDEAGTYYYQVAETTASGNGWTNEAVAKIVTVVVTDNGEGQLVAAVNGVSFTNAFQLVPITVHSVDADTSFARKIVVGTGFKETTFDFTLIETDSEGNRLEGAMEVKAKLDFTEAGTKAVDFGTFTYAEPGTYYYQVKETTPSGNGWSNDTIAKLVTVVVTTNDDGELVAEVTGVTITNTFKALPVDDDDDDKPEKPPIKKPEKPDKSNAPKTGDSGIVIYALILFFAVIGLIAIRRRKVSR